jgi:cytosine/adenosine deaminase-related metal-dependent hydrolase
MTTILIRNADMVIAWDASYQTHVYMPDADVAFDSGTLTFVGRNHPGTADATIDGRGLMVMPGLVNIHAHPSSEPMNKGGAGFRSLAALSCSATAMVTRLMKHATGGTCSARGSTTPGPSTQPR